VRAGDLLDAARHAYERGDWAAAVQSFGAARGAVGAEDLTADDLFALADAAWWLGDVDRSVSAGEEAYRRYLQGDRPSNAAMAALGVALNLLLRGDEALGSGWMSRAVRLVADRPDTAEHQYLRYLTQVEVFIAEAGSLSDADFEAAVDGAREVRRAGERLGDANLVAVGTMAEGRLLLKRGRAGPGLQLLDEAMVCVLGENLAPEWAGSVYCHLMEACHEAGDVARAREWTRATERWLETLPAAVLFRSICRVHRSQVLQTLGAWDKAEAEASKVCREVADVSPATAAEGRYQLGELYRLRGAHAEAELAYEQAHENGRDPQPGLALLRLAEGRVDVAQATIRAAVVARGGDVLSSFPLWRAQVDIALAAGDTTEAEQACAAVEDVAARYATSGFECDALHARGAVELACGRTEAALPVLREACRRWRALGADYRAAEVCVLLSEAYRNLGADDSAELELSAARAVFDRLGAARALDDTRELPGGLTAREAEVLALVAAGRSNREVAEALVISEKTVARHLSNIFVKIGVTSRTEAAAYAFHHGLHT
jgi:ATP/maltotriose-dependent transcriptional regulator MalT